MSTAVLDKAQAGPMGGGDSLGGAIPERALFTVLDETVARFGDRPCIHFLGREYSYRRVGELVDRAAKGLRGQGVGEGVRVGLCLPNTPYYVICYFAILKAGGTVVNYNPLYAEREMAHQISDSKTEIMITLDHAAIYPKVAGMLARTDLEKIVVCRMGAALPPAKSALYWLLRRRQIAAVASDPRHMSFEALIDNDGRVSAPRIDPATAVAVLQYTGGTTGLPKGAILTHANLAANAIQVRRWFAGLNEGEERFLGVLPLFHAFAMTVVMNVGITTGSELILVPRFDRGQVLKTIHDRRPTLFPGVPTLFATLAASPHLSRFDLSSIKYCFCGGAPLPAAVQDRFEALTGCILVEGYGLTEASPVVTCNPLSAARKEGSVGLPLAETVVEIHAMDAPERRLPPGEKGEICVTGPQVTRGYLGCHGDTARTIREGRLHTGDIGYLDEDGYLFLVDRIKDLILCNGYNVYPRVIEEAIHLHPEVAEVVAIAIADAHRGQVPKAFVRLRRGKSLTADALKTFLADKLSLIEIPAEIEFRDTLPRTMIGKLSKKELVAEEERKAARASESGERGTR